uniref:Uncharacterized protein n=1 Tax=Fervidobacterium pennivorans TaxID=93466 RepID=A0A7C4RXT4_FERPE
MKSMDGKSKIISKFMIVLGMVISIMGVFSIPSPLLRFPTFASILILLGSVLVSLGFGWHTLISSGGSLGEKMFVAVVCTAIILEALALVLYLVVEVEWVLVTAVVHVTRGYVEERPAVMPKISHVYASISSILAFTGIVLLPLAFYIKKVLS